MAKPLTELKRKDQKAVAERISKLTLRLRQTKHGWHGELHWPLEKTCSCKGKPESELVTGIEILTVDVKYDDDSSKAGDYCIVGRPAMSCPIQWLCDLGIDASRTFMDEAVALCLEKTWAMVAAIEPAVAKCPTPTRDEALAPMFGGYPRH